MQACQGQPVFPVDVLSRLQVECRAQRGVDPPCTGEQVQQVEPGGEVHHVPGRQQIPDVRLRFRAAVERDQGLGAGGLGRRVAGPTGQRLVHRVQRGGGIAARELDGGQGEVRIQRHGRREGRVGQAAAHLGERVVEAALPQVDLGPEPAHRAAGRRPLESGLGHRVQVLDVGVAVDQPQQGQGSIDVSGVHSPEHGPDRGAGAVALTACVQALDSRLGQGDQRTGLVASLRRAVLVPAQRRPGQPAARSRSIGRSFEHGLGHSCGLVEQPGLGQRPDRVGHVQGGVVPERPVAYEPDGPVDIRLQQHPGPGQRTLRRVRALREGRVDAGQGLGVSIGVGEQAGQDDACLGRERRGVDPVVVEAGLQIADGAARIATPGACRTP